MRRRASADTQHLLFEFEDPAEVRMAEEHELKRKQTKRDIVKAWPSNISLPATLWHTTEVSQETPKNNTKSKKTEKKL